MSIIPLPNKAMFEEATPDAAKLVIEPLYPGYGTTMGNLLRRVLLSSLTGTAISKIKIDGVDHEFSTLDHVKEDIVEIIMNVKKVRIKAHSELTEPLTLSLSVTGAKDVTAGDIEVPSQVEVVNPDFKIATITDDAGSLNMQLIVESGRGYVPVEQQEGENKEVGVMLIDANYSPVQKVGMEIHNVRVDKMTNYDSLTLDIQTDGTRTPEEAVKESIDIVREQLDVIYEGKESFEAPLPPIETEQPSEEGEQLEAAPAEESTEE